MASVVITKRRRIGSVPTGAIRRIIADELRDDIELKYHDTGHTFAAITSAASFDYLPLFMPPQGVGIQERIGLECKVSHLIVKIVARIGIAANPPRQFVRIRIIVDTMYDSDVTNRPVVQGGLTETHLPNSDAVTRATITQRDYTNASRYLMLMDKVIRLDTGNNTIVEYSEVIRRFKGVCHFVSSGSTTADIQKNSLWYHVMTDATTNGPEVGIQFRVRYSDI